MDGTVTTLTEQGFGFIRANDARDLFFHSKDLQGIQFAELKVGDLLQFGVNVGAKWPSAVKITRYVGGQWPPDTRESFPDQDMIALAIVEGKVRALGLTRDGACQFVDPQLNVHSLLYIGSETAALRYAIAEFESLLNQPKSSEAAFQDFFERFPEFILNEEHRAAHPHIVLEADLPKGRLIPDFVLEPVALGGLSDVLEIKLPFAPLYVQRTNRPRFSTAVYEACAQLREYSDFFERNENREKVATSYGLQLYRPNLFLIIGRTAVISPVLERRIQRDIGLPLYLRTFDDIVERMRARLRRQEWRSY